MKDKNIGAGWGGTLSNDARGAKNERGTTNRIRKRRRGRPALSRRGAASERFSGERAAAQVRR